MPHAPDKPLDLVLWGATGFTGRLVAEYLVEQGCAAKGSGLRWALGGRDEGRLEAVREGLAASDPAARRLPLVVGDSLDAESLRPIVDRTRVIATTVGPYAAYGSPLVRLCAESGVDYCDLSGEVPWMRWTVDTLHEPARASGARIVHCCGFDSIPSDIGVRVLAAAMEERGTRLSRARLRVKSLRGKMSGGTAASLLGIVAAAREDRAVRRVLVHPYSLNPPEERRGPDERDALGPRLDADRELWSGPFLMAGINTKIVRRTNALLGYPYGRDFRYDEAVDTGPGVAGRLRAIALAAGLGALTAGAAFPGTAWAVRRWVLPDVGEGPSREEREAGGFRIAIYGTGEAEAEGEPGLRLRVIVAADRDPGYGATARMLAESALCLARGEAERAEGGVLTPGSALGMPLVPRLEAAGIRFTVEAGT